MTRRELEDGLKARTCPFCGLSYLTQAATLAHVAEQHPVIATEYRGPVVVERVLQKPYRTERTPRIRARILHNNQEIPNVFGVDAFVQGVEWAVANL